MKIRMRGDISGTRNGRPWPRRGEVAEVPDDEGAALCSAGMAEPVAEPPAAKRVEKATPPAPEKRTRAKRTDAG